MREDGGARQQQHRESAEEQARIAAQTGSEYSELVAKGLRYESKQDHRKAGKALREAIALEPDRPLAYYNLGVALDSSGHYVEAAQRFLEAKDRCQMGSEAWAKATASAFDALRLPECAEVTKPEWWSDEGLKALSARLVRVAPYYGRAHWMRALVLRGREGAWEEGPRSAAEFMEAAAHYERTAALCDAPALQAAFAEFAHQCRSLAS